jgi:peptidyl-prolyl cis-trans isomerase D
MMQTMRENTKWVMLAVAIAFVGLMVFQWGMDLTGQSGAQYAGGEIGRVNGQSITYEQFNGVYRNLYDQQSQYTNGPVGSAMNRQIEDGAWDQIVMQSLISQELKRRGIVVTDAEIRQAALYEPPTEFRSDPMFQTDGQFDLNKYHQYMANASLNTDLMLQMEAYYRDAIPRSKLFFQQTAATFVTDDQLWQMWRDSRDAVTVKFIAFDPQALVQEEGITVSDAEIASWYQKHQSEFVRPARATVKYIAFSRTPNAADSAAALARVTRLRKQIVDGGDFVEIARAESADTISGKDGGLMSLTKGQTVPAFDQAAFSQRIGQVSEPVLTQYGYHIIRTESRSGDSAQVRHVLIPIQLTPEHENLVLDRADSLDVLTESLKLDAIGQNLGLEVQQTDLIPGLAFVPGVGNAADGEDWVFHEAQPGEVSQVFETPSAYYTFELVSREDERTLTVDEAKETIRTGLVLQKKVGRAKEMAREAIDRIRAGQSMEAVASSLGLQVQDAGPFTRGDFVPGMGRMNAAIGTAFGLKPGETSGAVEADNSVYVIRTVSRQDADRAAWEAQKDEQRQRVISTLQQQGWEQYLDALRKNAKVVDKRDEVLRKSGTTQATTQ